jgi:hypothetical protein
MMKLFSTRVRCVLVLGCVLGFCHVEAEAASAREARYSVSVLPAYGVYGNKETDEIISYGICSDKDFDRSIEEADSFLKTSERYGKKSTIHLAIRSAEYVQQFLKRLAGNFSHKELNVMRRVQVLDFQDCSMVTEFPRGCFAKLGGLIGLSLHKCTSLKGFSVAGLKKLESLLVEGSRRNENQQYMDKLTGYGIEQLTNLDLLDLNYWNNIKEIPKGYFNRLRNLRALGIEFSAMKKLSHGCFDSLKKLESLFLHGCSALQELPVGCLDGLADLESLSLSGSGIERLACERGCYIGSLGSGFSEKKTQKDIIDKLVRAGAYVRGSAAS